jgi:hypothetical protein
MEKWADRCLIYYELNGVERSWAISALPGVDSDETLKKHLSKWIPNAKYLSHKFSPDELDSFEEKLIRQEKPV